jgi:hypothetical protein
VATGRSGPCWMVMHTDMNNRAASSILAATTVLFALLVSDAAGAAATALPAPSTSTTFAPRLPMIQLPARVQNVKLATSVAYDGGPVSYNVELFNPRTSTVKGYFRLAPVSQTFGVDLAPGATATEVVTDPYGVAVCGSAKKYQVSGGGEGFEHDDHTVTATPSCTFSMKEEKDYNMWSPDKVAAMKDKALYYGDVTMTGSAACGGVFMLKTKVVNKTALPANEVRLKLNGVSASSAPFSIPAGGSKDVSLAFTYSGTAGRLGLVFDTASFNGKTSNMGYALVAGRACSLAVTFQK